MATEATRDPGDDALATATGQYVLDEISLERAGETVGLSRWKFEKLLENVGFTARYGPRSEEAVRDEVDVAIELA